MDLREIWIRRKRRAQGASTSLGSSPWPDTIKLTPDFKEDRHLLNSDQDELTFVPITIDDEWLFEESVSVPLDPVEGAFMTYMLGESTYGYTAEIEYEGVKGPVHLESSKKIHGCITCFGDKENHIPVAGWQVKSHGHAVKLELETEFPNPIKL